MRRRRRSLALALPVLLVLPAPGAAAQAPRQLELTTTLRARGEYGYLPFRVPGGVNRVAVDVSRSSPRAKLGAGLFDERGPGYGSRGFRGIYGEELSSFFVSARHASRAFVPGRIRPGRWTVIVPAYDVPEPTRVTARVTLSFGRQGRAPRRERAPELVRDRPGWYRGDLHAHTTFSSDAFSSGSGRSPRALAALARRSGLDFLSLTDHNVTAQNDRLRSAAPRGFLLLGGEEVTTWFNGHSTASGLRAGDFFDWRLQPRGTPRKRYHRGVRAYLDAARRRDVYTAAAHPGIPVGGNEWDFFGDANSDRRALPDGLEVWNGPWDGLDELALPLWDDQLKRGRRVWANGGSDVHGIRNDDRNAVGRPTTVVYADALSRRAIVAALRAGRSYVTEGPRGPGLFLTAAGPGGQRLGPGGTVRGRRGATVRLSVLVRGGRGAVLTLKRDGAVVASVPVTGDERTLRFRERIGRGGAVRLELRAGEVVRALSNPVLLRSGRVPARPARTAPPPPPA